MSLSSHQDVSFVDWLHASAINNEESDGSTDEISQSSQSTTMDLASPFRLHYVYPPSDVDLASSPNSPYHRYSYFPTSALPAVFLNHRMDSIDSNATLLATPSPKSLRFSSVSSDITPRYSTNSPFYVNSDKAFVSTLFEQVYRIEEEWDTLHQDISPVLRTRHEAEPRTKKGDAKLETLGHSN
ncbi:hypothetical protein BDQ17DRAFT_1354104 [Cyathus striatus]|nr:hypothetical protein BDQ17DRAFT_1354104 [Cyathus striatus]